MSRRPNRLAVPGFERVRRGPHAVLVCLNRRNYPGHETEPCPYVVIIGQPGDEIAEVQARAAADEHRTTWHGGMSADIWAAAAAGQLEQTGEIGR
jgi:hypothetical protein